MAYVCGSCDFFDGDNAHTTTCPSCGGRMRMTMLDPRASSGVITATLAPPSSQTRVAKVQAAAVAVDSPPAKQTVGKDDWTNPYQYGYEVIEAPWACRYAQIGVGLTFYYIMWRWGRVAVSLLFVVTQDVSKSGKELIVLGVTLIALNCLAAVLAGMIAGFWAKNWIPQGLGVAAGVMFIPLLSMLVFAPESWPLACISLVLTSMMTLFGAFVGHLIVKPTRIARS